MNTHTTSHPKNQSRTLTMFEFLEEIEDSVVGLSYDKIITIGVNEENNDLHIRAFGVGDHPMALVAEMFHAALNQLGEMKGADFDIRSALCLHSMLEALKNEGLRLIEEKGILKEPKGDAA